MNKPNELGQEVKGLSEKQGRVEPAISDEIAEVDATMLLVNHGFCSLHEGRFRLDAIRAKHNFRREHKKPQDQQGRSTHVAGTPPNIEALAETCNKNPEFLRHVLTMLPHAHAQDLLSRIVKPG